MKKDMSASMTRAAACRPIHLAGKGQVNAIPLYDISLIEGKNRYFLKFELGFLMNLVLLDV